MDRRDFLKSMGALAAAATSMPSFAAITEPNKYACDRNRPRHALSRTAEEAHDNE